MKFLLFCTVSIFCLAEIFGQSIQWSSTLKTSEQLKFFKNDSLSYRDNIYTMRQFVYDSLKRVSSETGTVFSERLYSGSFTTPTEISHIILSFKDATRLVYYIELYDTDEKVHLVYDYGTTSICDASDNFLLTIARTPYKVKRIEIGTFISNQSVNKVGISSEVDGNKLIKEMIEARMLSVCSRTSFLTDKEALPVVINTPYDEVKPIISSDGKTLLFHRQYSELNTGGKKDAQDIFISQLKGTTWLPSQNMGTPLNDRESNGVAAVSPGNNALYMINEYVEPNKHKQGLSYSGKTINGWPFPNKVNVKNFYNLSPYFDYFVSATQNEMILAAQRNDAIGDQDLYVSFFDDVSNEWSEPVNLGEQINTFLSETSPYLASDGKTLYFASDGYLGYGGFDLYVTRRLDDSWLNWSAPENIGPVINSEEDDLYYTIAAAGDFAYFVSQRNGNRDIFRVTLPKIYKPEPVVLLSGKILDASTGTPTSADLKFTWHGETEAIGFGKAGPTSGEYKLVLPAEGIYDFVVEKEGFQTVVGTISTMNLKSYSEKQKDILIIPVSDVEEKEIVVPMPQNSEAWKQKLEQIALFAKHLPYYSVSIEGYLSESNSIAGYTSIEQIIQYMVMSGVKKENIHATEKTDSAIVFRLTPILSTKPVSEVVAIPSDYKKPQPTTSGTSLLLKGKIIDAATLKPMPVRMVFKIKDKVESRSSSNPEYGYYQALIADNSSYEVKLYQDKKEYVVTYTSPKKSSFEEIEKTMIVGASSGKATKAEIGTLFSKNMNEKESAKWVKSLKKKKSSKELIALTVNENIPLPQRIELDLEHLSNILVSNPEYGITLRTHASAKIKDYKTVQEKLAKRFVDHLKERGVQQKIEIKIFDFVEPKNSNPKHHTNTRVEAEVIFR